MDTEIIAAKIEVTSPSMQQSSEDTSDEFKARRFYALSTSHNSAVLIGSSLAHQQQSYASEHVLDAAATTYIKDANGVVIGVKQATADGLGGSPDDPNENASIAKIAEFACEKFVRSTKPAHDTYLEIAQESEAQALNFVATQKYESHCAMAAASFIYSGEGKYQGELANMGDTMVLVLDKDFNLKKALPARQVYRGFGQWAPPSVQMLTKPRYQSNFTSTQLDVDEGDYIISMTDGIWGELPLLPISKSGDEVKELSIDPDQLITNSKKGSATYFPVHQCTSEILTQALDNSLKKRKELLDLVNELRALGLGHDSKTVDQVLADLADTKKTALANNLYQLLFEGNGGDGTTYFKGVEIPFAFVMKDLQERTAGDCSTINMVRIPFHLDELLRAFINSPANRRNLLNEIALYLGSPAALRESISRLKQEEVLSEPKLLLEDFSTRPAFSAAMLDDLQSLVEQFNNLSVILRIAKYADKIVALTTYLQGVEQPIRDYLVNLIRPELSLQTNIFTYFFGEDRKLRNNFSHQFGLGQPFSAANYQQDVIELDESPSFG
ncbi:Phosphocholine hydrolase Lem3 [Legionella massiliensis]|uniref:Phosphocholine hydrolase Lem3 n=1 Tax=Legionella massiliensis TaxID=1034943 RepID=A0A078L2I4_9GAMM|nr:hypothetical protein [Legionella massiliensis]CDZ78218.1 Phosphocholine hydrolase Lem3 [Legionella massiliensis]CEE13956.1 Phosphocholine hydrolase Lem3 [Legionella massiliensis]